jgi:type II secretory pathway pseudopilin PulG
MTPGFRTKLPVNHRGAFTLIEVLVASTLVILLLSMVTGTLLHISRISARTSGVLAMHDAVSGLQRVLAERSQAVHHGTAWHCTADPGANGWGDGDESVELTWMGTMPAREEAGGGLYQSDQTDLTWYRLTWRAAKHAQTPGIFLSRSSGIRTNISQAWNWVPDPTVANMFYSLAVWSQPRRDRRRDLDDNDLRYIEGLSPALYTSCRAGGIIGDGELLRRNSRPALAPGILVDDFRLEWIDRAGWTTTFDATRGLTRRDASGAVQPWLGQPWSSATRVSLDGVFMDGRPHTLAPDPRDVNDARPALLRLAFTLRQEPPPGAGKARENIVQTFALSFPLGSGLPAP